MKYQIGTVCLDKVTDQTIIYPNKTRKYLLPCLNEYGDTLISKLNNVFKVAVGLGDMIISSRYYKIPERHLFILIDTTIARKYFSDFITDFIRYQEYYEDDYVFGNLVKSKFHMVVIKFPEKYYDVFDTFKEGKYSEMFTRDSIDKIFKSKDNSSAPRVLIKDENYKIVFTKRLNKMFGLTGKHAINPKEWDGELDLPPNYNEENFK